MLPGVDVHAGYGRIDWGLVAVAGYRFVYAKGPEGNEPNRDDLTWRRNVDEAQANGVAAGIYVVPWPLPHGPGLPAGRHPLEQAERFHVRVRGYGGREGELSPAVDAEWPPPEEWAKWGCSAPQISEWLREHCEAVTLLWGRLPIIYTYPHWWRTLAAGADVSWASRYMLWIADYSWPQAGHPPDGWAPTKLSWVRATWDDWTICQHSADGSLVRVPGIPACPVDRNVIRDETTLERLRGIVRIGPDDDTLPDVRLSVGPQPIVRTMPDTLIPCPRCHLQGCDGACPDAA